LALVVIHPCDALPEPFGREDVDRGVELADAPLFGSRIGLLDDGDEVTIVVPGRGGRMATAFGHSNESTVTAARRRLCSSTSSPRVLVVTSGVSADRMSIACEASKSLARRRHRVCGAVRLRLHGDLDVSEDFWSPGREDDHERPGIDSPRRLEHPPNHRLPVQLREGLRRHLLHTGSAAACHHDRGQVLTWSKRSRGAARLVGCPLGLEQRMALGSDGGSD
jgi:hypothetical protein